MDVLKQLKTATDTLKDAHKDVYEAQRELLRTKRFLQARENTLTAAGLEGKNEAARKAELAAQCITEQRNVDLAEDDLREAQANLTLAELDYKFAREAAALHRAELLNRAPIAAD